MTETSLADRTPRRRIVLLGASNLTRGVGRAVAIARSIWNEPVELLLAHGHGRSYGLSSSVLFRTLPGIARCGLWTALKDAPPAPAFALLTDIGNDIFYGAKVETIAAWIETCVDRLAAAEAEIVISRLPMASAQTLSPQWFAAVRRLIFPTRRLTLDEVLQKAEELDGRIVELAARRGFAVVAPPAAWYGLDPIHIRRRKFAAAWRAYFSHWTEGPKGEQTGAEFAVRGAYSPALWLRIRTCLPEEVRYFGMTMDRRQPCVRLRDGTSVAMY